MTTEENLKLLNRSARHLLKITDTLWGKHLEDKAWIIAMREVIEDLIAAQPGKTQKAAEVAIKKRQRAVLQTLLERVENQSPSIAAQLDRRDIRDVL